jgi:serine/threonine protein kinase
MIKTVAFDRLVGTELGQYRLERFLGQSKIGPTFLASTNASTSYLVRFVDSPLYMMDRERDAYLEQFQLRARQIATLQHPYILPLLDYGIYRGFPYLVSPHIPLRTLRTRVVKYGVMDTFTVGRYLDQTSTALEYAHEHAILHGNLSVDSIFIRLDGNVVVADIGIKNLIEQDLAGNYPTSWSEGCAPELLLGRPASPASDVYALGMVVFYLLTGSEVFRGATTDELAQQHLYSPVPALNQVRSDLPPSLIGVLTRALAKDPAQRYSQPGAFANAFHQSGVPTNRMRVPFVLNEAPVVQVYQVPESASSITETPYYDRGRSVIGAIPSDTRTPLPPIRSSNPHSLHGFPEDEPLKVSFSSQPRQALMRRMQKKQNQRTILIGALLSLVVIVGGIIGFATLGRGQNNVVTSSTSGQVTFYTDQENPDGQTNSLRIAIQHLSAPPSGSRYDAWIIDDHTEQVTGLGSLVQQGQNWTLTFSNGSTDVLTAGDKFEITLEQGTVTAPAGQVVLVGKFPLNSYAHVLHLLDGFPETPGKVGFLVGFMAQIHLLDNQAAFLQSVAASKNPVAISCVAQSMLDIIDGTHGANYKPLSDTCKAQNVLAAGDGFGLLGKNGYTAGIEEHASLALSQSDATPGMHTHAALMNIALTNVNGWVTTVERDLLQLQAHPTNTSSVSEIARLSDIVYHGVDANGDGQVDPVPGEAGALIAYQQGQLMATLTLTPGS